MSWTDLMGWVADSHRMTKEAQKAQKAQKAQNNGK
jgi:hypothetical protein